MSLTESKIEKFTDNGFTYSYCAPKLCKEPENVVFILHGDDTNIDRWQRRIRQMHKAMPNTAVIAIQGDVKGYAKKHHDAKVAGKGEKVYRWVKRSNAFEFSTSFIGDKLFGHSASRKVEKFIDAKLAEFDLESKDSAVIGCSMGGVASVSSHVNRKNPYGAFVLASSGVMTAKPLFVKIKQSLSKQFNASAAPREVYISQMERDNIFDTRAREANKKMNGKSNFISRVISGAYSSLFGKEESVKRLEKAGVKIVTKVYNTLPKNNNNRHKTTDTMWFDDIKYVAQKLGARFDVGVAEKAMKPWVAKKHEFNLQASALIAAMGISRAEAEARIKEADRFNKNPQNKLKSVITGYKA